jgi:hypothetical protein
MRFSSAALSTAKLTWQDLYEICVRTTRITGVIFLIIASATILGWWMTFNQIPQAIARGAAVGFRKSDGGHRPDPAAAAADRAGHGHQRDADHPGPGAGAADRCRSAWIRSTPGS